MEQENNKNKFVHALTFLEDAAKTLGDRAQLRDKPQGERSMKALIKVFNALTGRDLTESEGWEFMICLKLVRGRQGKFHPDDYLDASAYSALLGECESQKDRGTG
jgi:hypothetical protein